MKTIIAAALMMLLPVYAFAARHDPSFTFSTIQTEHFAIQFHQGLDGIAFKSAMLAEQAHQQLTKIFAWEPADRTQIVLIDDTDFTNGMAITLPYNTIFIQTVAPDSSSALGEYEDWLQTIIVHEYSHILSSDPSRGYSTVMRRIFGRPVPGLDPLSQLAFIATAPPNTFMPRWWHEGVATWSETVHTGLGRGRSSFYDMIFRAAVAENNLPSIAQINGDPPEWPNGSLPYIFGFRLQKYIADTYGADIIGKLNLAHAGRFPYFINGAAQDNLDSKSYREVYADMLTNLRSEQTAKINTLAAVPFTPVQTLYKEGENLHKPRFSPDGQLIAINRSDPHDHYSTVIINRSNQQLLTQFRRTASDGSSCWSPDSKQLYFTQAEVNQGFNIYQDLYQFDMTSQHVSRLTHGLRLKNPEISPDGRTFAMVLNNRGSQNLALLDFPTNRQDFAQLKPRLITSYDMYRVSTPRWSPDSRYVSFVVTENSGKSSLQLFNVEKGTSRTLLSADHAIIAPTWSPDSTFLLYGSDETGVFNLFVYDFKDDRSYQLSHLLGGAMQPDISPDGKQVIFSSYGSHGFSIAAMDLENNTWREHKGPFLPAQQRNAVNSVTDEKTGLTPPPPLSSTEKVTPYSPWETLYPRFWLPRLASDGKDSAAYGAYTAGQDVLGYNSYYVTTDYSPQRRKLYYNLVYQNDYLYPTFSLQAFSQPLLYSNLLQRGDYYELNRGATIEATVPINRFESGYRFSLGYQLLNQQSLDSLGDFSTQDRAVFRGWRNSMFATLSFDNRLKYPHSISPEEGRTISFQYRHFSRNLGSDLNSSEYSAAYQEFTAMPTATLKHHVVYLRLSGAIADGDRTLQQAFQMGGAPSDLNQYPLRGYPARSAQGKYITTGTLEYLAPIRVPQLGFGTIPFYENKIFAAFFLDAGQIWDEKNAFGWDKVKTGIGMEARLNMTVGYWLRITPALGVAQGLNGGGETQVYLTVYADL
jgi:Tol biopolymer transport system component